MTAEELARKRTETRNALDQHRRELELAVHELRVAGREALTPSSRLERKPYRWLLGALALGVWMGWRRSPGG